MNTQTVTTERVFRRPFFLSGLEGAQPPGNYRIETYSELLDIPDAVVYRRLTTSIDLHNQPSGIIRRATIDPAELEEALRLDAAPEIETTRIATTKPDPRLVVTPPAAAPSSGLFSNQAVAWYGRGASSSGERPGLWRQWIFLNANELTWIALVIGGLLLVSIGR